MKFVTLVFLALGAQSLFAQQSNNSQGTATLIKSAPGKSVKTADSNANQVVTYSNQELGLAFDHPKSWKQSKQKVHNKTKFNITDPKTWRPDAVETTTRFLIPLPGVDEKGVLDIYSVQFFADPSIWQTSQVDINDQMSKMPGAGPRTIERQWAGEILGVPLLMTRIDSADKGQKLVTETGLMYSATPRKFIYRLSASPDNFDKADYAWQEALKTLRTTDGRLPNAEDPNRKLSPAELNPGSYHKVIWTIPTPLKTTPVKGPVVAEAVAAAQKLVVRAPAGWKLQKNNDGSFSVSSPEITGSAKLTVASDVDSDPYDKALFKSMGVTLNDFSKVEHRMELGPALSRSEMSLHEVARIGMKGSQPIASFDAAGSKGDYYWVLSWEGVGPAAAKQTRPLQDLVQVLSVEPAN